MRDIKKSLQCLTALRDMGIRIAIDDFGIGYASLATLKQFPLDTIKIDRSLIRDVASVPENKNLAKAIIAMGKTLSLNVVAQGVETEEQADFLRQNACDEIQGFYFSHAVAADELARIGRSGYPASRERSVTLCAHQVARTLNVDFHFEQRVRKALAVRVHRERGGDAAAERLLAHELQRADVRHFMARDLAVDDVREVALDRLRGDLRCTAPRSPASRYAISDRMDVLPLSPARQCARSYSFFFTPPLPHRHFASDFLARDQAGDDADLLVHVLARAAAAARPVRPQRFDLLADQRRFLARGRARRDAQAHFVRTRGLVVRLAVQRRAADVIDAHFLERALQPRLHDFAGELRALQRVRAGVADFAFADVTRVITDADLERRRARLAGRAGHGDAIRTRLLELHRGEIGGDVGRHVGARIGHLVEQLLFRGDQVDRAAGVGGLADDAVAVAVDVRVRKPDVREIRNVLPCPDRRSSRR